jgi:hypothetical protein
MRFALLAAASLAAAPALATDLDDLAKWANGTWKCRARAGDDVYNFTLKFAWNLDKKWLVARLDGKAAKGKERVRSVNLYGWDAGQSRVVSLFLNNQGARGESTSPGWSQDSLVFSGTVELGGHRTETTTTVTRRGKREMAMVARTGGFAAETTCRK